jgi:predicted ATPase/class 3 adenylate cyclase
LTGGENDDNHSKITTRELPTAIPSGVLTFLFTDIEASTKKWERDAAVMSTALARHDRILRQGIESRGGYVFKTIGDAFCAAFSDPLDALRSTIDIQRALAAEHWKIPGGIVVRMALHSGAAEERDGDYFGQTLNRTARILSLVYGGQVLLSLAATELLADRLPPECSLERLGQFRLKDLSRPEALSQLRAPGLQERFPALKSLDHKPNNLPLQPTAFIGRDCEVEGIMRAFAEPECRLLTLVGPGGVGKTRLSVQAGAELIEDFEAGVWFVDLSDCVDEASSIQSINRVLGVKEGSGLDPGRSLEELIGQRHILLILDNLEQDLAGPTLIAGLLTACPRLSVLATSREALRLRWERLLALPPLGLPLPGESQTLASLSRYEALRLFAARADAVRRGFALDDRSAPAVARICARLEGMPLAIELAASRARSFSPEAILERLELDLDFLDSGAPDLPARQRTLRAVEAWSYNLLARPEKAAFRAVSVFSKAFTLESAESVLAAGEGGSRLSKAADRLLSSLVDKSLVTCVEDADGSLRFRLLETLKSYAREHLERRREAEAVAEAHAGRYRSLAASPSAGAFSEIDREYPEYCTAFEYFLGHRRAREAFDLALGLARYRELRGMLAEGIGDLERALALGAEVEAEGIDAAAGRFALAELRRRKGDFQAALEDYGLSRSLARERGDGGAAARAEIGSGWAWYRLSDMKAARALWEGAKSAAQRLEAAIAEEGLGTLALAEGRLEEALARLGAAAAELKSLGELCREQVAINNIGICQVRLGRTQDSMQSFRRAIEIAEGLGDLENAFLAKNNLACTLQDLGDHEGAVAILRGISEKARTMAGVPCLLISLVGLVESLVALGRLDEARLGVGECSALAALDADPLHKSWAQSVLGQVLGASGEGEAADECFDRAESLARESAHVFELDRIAALRRKASC